LSAGHAIVQNLRRGHYEIATDEPIHNRLRIALTSLQGPSKADGGGTAVAPIS
jgi:hypothetical protein